MTTSPGRATTRFCATRSAGSARRCGSCSGSSIRAGACACTRPGQATRGGAGVRYVGGEKRVIAGEGIGSNYWDLLPFGARMRSRRSILRRAARPGRPRSGDRRPSGVVHRDRRGRPRARGAAPPCCRGEGVRHEAALERRDRAVRNRRPRRELHDYGFTFLNNEAVYYGFATPEQARSIRAWIAGERVVAGTHRRAGHLSLEVRPPQHDEAEHRLLFLGVVESESIPSAPGAGRGAVLGWSFHDLMARLMTAGPDDAARRLRDICAWFDETQAAGGYRAYYADPARGTLQGGNVPGGLGLDREFFESILVRRSCSTASWGSRRRSRAARSPPTPRRLAVPHHHPHPSARSRARRDDAREGDRSRRSRRRSLAFEDRDAAGWTLTCRRE